MNTAFNIELEELSINDCIATHGGGPWLVGVGIGTGIAMGYGLMCFAYINALR